MTILLVPPTGAAGSNVVFPCLLFLFCFFLSCADSPWFSFYLFLFFFWLISRIEGVVWRGWMTSLLCLFRIVWRQGAGHSWRTQDGDGSQGSKVPGGLAGRTWLCYSYHKLLPLPGGCHVLWCACCFPFVLRLPLFTSSRVIIFSIFSSSLFSSVCHISCGGGTTVCFFNLFFFSSSLSICLFVFAFSLFPSVSIS